MPHHPVGRAIEAWTSTGCRPPGGTVQKLVAEIMAASRRAERLVGELPDGSPEHEAARRAWDRLRDAFQELTHSGVVDGLSAAKARLLLRDAASDIDGVPGT
jgi:hypothetical protein